MRLADVFGIDREAISDGDFVITCTCGLEQRLDAMTVDEEADLTLYDCARCESSVIGIMPDVIAKELWRSVSETTRNNGIQGHHINGYVVGSKVDLALQPPGSGLDDVELLLGTPNFFMVLRSL